MRQVRRLDLPPVHGAVSSGSALPRLREHRSGPNIPIDADRIHDHNRFISGRLDWIRRRLCRHRLGAVESATGILDRECMFTFFSISLFLLSVCCLHVVSVLSVYCQSVVSMLSVCCQCVVSMLSV